MDWLNDYYEETDKFPRLNWDGVYKHVDENYKHYEDEKLDELWTNIARYWMSNIINKLNDNYGIHESNNFILVTSEDENYVCNTLGYLERTLKRILSSLEGIASDEGFGKHILIIFDDIDAYYSYLSHYYSEDGEYALSSGVYLNNGYGHFAFPHQELNFAESITAHEMTHALLSHLKIPAWLNEGIAVTIENLLTGSFPFRMDDETYMRHKSYWIEEEIQKFWSGDIFHEAGEGNELGYYLAQFAVHSLSKDYEAFKEFVNNAEFRDGGEEAANKVYGVSLGELIQQYFGEGDWSPAPEKWETRQVDKPNLTPMIL